MTTFEQFIEQYPFGVFEKGQTILLKDDTPEAAYIIESGLVKAYTITSDGSERLVAIHSQGGEFPVGLATGLISKSQYFYEAYSKCVVRLVPQKDYIKHLKSDLESIYDRYIYMTTLMVAVLSRIDAFEQPRASDKIAFTLLYMADHIGIKLRPYNSRLKLSITQQEIANSLGITRETASAELKKLELKKLITHSRKSYILYMERLRKYLDDRQ